MSENEPPEGLADQLRSVMSDDMIRRLQSVNPRTRDEAVAELVTPHQSMADFLRLMTPQERLEWLQRRLELCIALTPTGLERGAMTEANIRIMVGRDGGGST